MQVRCPNCHSTMESIDPLTHQGVNCSTCGERFVLVGDETQTFRNGGTADVPPTFGQFVLLEIVGQGGFGTVWRARDTELDRIVAVKMPRRGLIAADEEHQFVREARAAAQLQHSNIVSVHEVGRIDELLYIVCDFVDGDTLARWLRRNRPTSRRTAELCQTIAEAMEHAHQAGIVHRDLKPSNILLDAQESPHIADFGLATRSSGDMTVTFDGQILGTPAYMSPEQAGGDVVDGRTDVYAIGVILFELLTGERPFRGNHRMIIQQVINDEAPSPRRLNGSIPRDLETICLKCLEKSPARRYASAGELADDLRRYLANEPIHARPIGRFERIGKWARRRPLAATLLSAFLLAVVLGVSGVTWQWRQVMTSQRRLARTQVELLQTAEPQAVSSAIPALADLREWTVPILRMRAADESLPDRDRYRVHLPLVAINSANGEDAEFIVESLLNTSGPGVLDLDELALGTGVLANAGVLPASRLIQLAGDDSQPPARRFRALLMLAQSTRTMSDTAAMDWNMWAEFIAHGLVTRATSDPEQYSTLVDAFRPIRMHLIPELSRLMTGADVDPNRRFAAASMIGEYAADQPATLCDLLLAARPDEYGVLLQRLEPHREVAAARFEELLAGTDDNRLADKAVAAVTLLHLGNRSEGVWSLLRQSPQMELRTMLIHRCAELKVPPETLIGSNPSQSDPSIRRALLLALGEYDELPARIRNELRPRLEDWYRHDADCGVHSAIAWLMRSWGEGAAVERMDTEPGFAGPVADRQWYVNSLGCTMVVIDHPPVFLMGSPAGEPMRTEADRQHLREVDRQYAIATTEVTWSQFEEFLADVPTTDHSHPETYGPDPQGPALNVSWIEAARFCRWLSEREQIPDDQMCFPDVEEIHYEMSLPDDLMQRTGYRLPSEGEWECACRAGTTTMRFFGESDAYLDRYGWHIGNSGDFAWRVGTLKPNDYGLFDLYGNAWEWCLDRKGRLPTRPPGQVFADAPKLAGSSVERVLRGGSMNTRATALRSAHRDYLDAGHNRNHNVGFRVVRTLPDEVTIDSE